MNITRETLQNSALSAAILMAAVSIPTAAQAQTVNGFADLISPVTVGNVNSFNFGDIVPSAGGGTVVLTTAGTRSATGGIGLTSSGGAAGSLVVSGSTSGTFTIILSGSVRLTEVADPTKILTAGAFTLKVGSGTEQTYSSAVNGTLVNGTSVVLIGGTLTIPANAALGDYATNHTGGTPLTVTIAYN